MSDARSVRRLHRIFPTGFLVQRPPRSPRHKLQHEWGLYNLPNLVPVLTALAPYTTRLQPQIRAVLRFAALHESRQGVPLRAALYQRLRDLKRR